MYVRFYRSCGDVYVCINKYIICMYITHTLVVSILRTMTFWNRDVRAQPHESRELAHKAWFKAMFQLFCVPMVTTSPIYW
jgi:hypothetical protein